MLTYGEKRGVLIVTVILFGVFLFCATEAFSRDNGQWADAPLNIRQWFQGLMQPDAPMVSCCGQADAYEADDFEVSGDHYVAIITDGKGVIPDGTRIEVPNGKLKVDQGNPTSHGIIFLGQGGQLYCFVPPSGV